MINTRSVGPRMTALHPRPSASPGVINNSQRMWLVDIALGDEGRAVAKFFKSSVWEESNLIFEDAPISLKHNVEQAEGSLSVENPLDSSSRSIQHRLITAVTQTQTGPEIIVQ